MDTSPASAPAVTVYWRPGCTFCIKLWVKLRLTGTRYRPVNIWRDPEAAAFVRSVNDGNETVPTVRVVSPTGTGSVMTNPSLKRIRQALAG
ncbi:glutaredoxin domain-containing protein [Streptomyces sp. AB3(2024)]|uniref:glutaredoxin domain-containing protein n=1 Tax=Streptomyces sp. AB3(2024) TaxID=3317321 RepID=UPI0035A2FF2D